MSTLTPEMESFKDRLKATWMAGDFTQIARSYESGAAEFIERLNLAQGTYVLDGACGTGNLAIPSRMHGRSRHGSRYCHQFYLNKDDPALRLKD